MRAILWSIITRARMNENTDRYIMSIITIKIYWLIFSSFLFIETRLSKDVGLASVG